MPWELHCKQPRLPDALLWGNNLLQSLFNAVKVFFFLPPTTLMIIKNKKKLTEVKSVHAVTRGTFFQGYQCTRCKMAAHKECLGRVSGCGRNSGLYEVIHSCTVILDLLNISSYINCPVEFTDHSGNIKRQVQNCFTWTELNFLFKWNFVLI